MEQEQLDNFKNRLTAEKENLQRELKESDKLNMDNSLSEATSELSAYDNHPADLGSETFEREKDLALIGNRTQILERIDNAIERINNGGYGTCELCGREINLERLEAVPYTTFCIDCQRLQEEQITRERPIEEEFLNPPFGRTFLDGTDVVVTDGEDVWQAVARYGTSETPSDLGGVNSYDDMYIDSEEGNGIVQPVEAVIDGERGDIMEESEDYKE